jgi:hypothetical protein
LREGAAVSDFSGEFFCRAVRFFIIEEDIGSGFCEETNCGSADAARSAGDEGVRAARTLVAGNYWDLSRDWRRSSPQSTQTDATEGIF